MFSLNIYFEIARIMQKAREEMHSGKAIDQVTIILGYVQLSLREVTGYDAKLKTGIQRLLELAKQEKRSQLIDDLEALVQAMDQGRAA